LRSLEQSQTLESSSLVNNKFGSDYDELFHNLIRDAHSLKYLNLSSNPLKGQVLNQIADALIDNHSILSLDSTPTLMADEFAISFGRVISESNTL